MIDYNHFICHFIFGGHLLNIPTVALGVSALCSMSKKESSILLKHNLTI